MDTMHEAGIKTFVDGIGKPRLLGHTAGVYHGRRRKVFELTCAETQWAVEPDFVINAATYNNILPGR